MSFQFQTVLSKVPVFNGVDRQGHMTMKVKTSAFNMIISENFVSVRMKFGMLLRNVNHMNTTAI